MCVAPVDLHMNSVEGFALYIAPMANADWHISWIFNEEMITCSLLIEIGVPSCTVLQVIGGTGSIAEGTAGHCGKKSVQVSHAHRTPDFLLQCLSVCFSVILDRSAHYCKTIC